LINHLAPIQSIENLREPTENLMQMLRLYATPDGESHYDTIEYSMNLLDDSPPAKPHWFTDAQTAKSWVYVRCPVGWDGGLHPTPRRQIVICTSGSLRVTSSLDDTRELKPGDAVLLEDTSGKGHISEVTSQIDFEAFAIRLE
jgi:hypothetical protein